MPACCIAHIDVDAFFASVLVRADPSLQGKPLLALGMGGGCVIAASYEAKAKGIKTGMRLLDARKLCPGAIERISDFAEACRASVHIEEILARECPAMEKMSVDEWFLDLRTLVGGIPEDLGAWALDTQCMIRRHLDLTVSVGIGPTKTLAKMASEYRKPAGATIVIGTQSPAKNHEASRPEPSRRAAGATIVGDLIVLLTTFLSGEELTLAFLLKVLVVLLVAGAGFMHFMADLWGYWVQNPGRARMVNWSVGVLVIFAIIAGFFIVGTPGQAREYRLDQQKVNDLQSIQSQVVYYWQQKQKLPATLAELNDPLSYYSVPVDPQTGSAYTYQVNGARSFELCAEFNTKSDGISAKGRVVTMPVALGTNDNWQHAAGGQCFSRTIDPERYPPIIKPVQY